MLVSLPWRFGACCSFIRTGNIMRTVIKQCSHNIRQFESIKKGHSVPTIYFLIIYTNLIGWESAKTRKLIMQKEGNKHKYLREWSKKRYIVGWRADERSSSLVILHMHKHKDIDSVVCPSEGKTYRPLLVTSLMASLFYPFFHTNCTLLIWHQRWSKRKS